MGGFPISVSLDGIRATLLVHDDDHRVFVPVTLDADGARDVIRELTAFVEKSESMRGFEERQTRLSEKHWG